MSIINQLIVLCAFMLASSGQRSVKPEWGFFGHKKINRMAVFTLPQEMIGFYKKHIEYVTEHSIDPDKRRYNTDYEAIRHYIDLDNFGELPFDNLPRKFSEAIAFNSEVYLLTGKSDSTLLMNTSDYSDFRIKQMKNDKCSIETEDFIDWNQSLIERFGQRMNYTEEFGADEFPRWLNISPQLGRGKIAVVDKFSEHGIAPFYLEKIYFDLIIAFRNYDGKKILQLSSDIGHYIADIHVPLHTTRNYNGADTDQLGIHAFWETRLPELYAETSYDLMVGKADFISDENKYFWDTVLRSHELLDEVFAVEKKLSQSFPSDQQYCYEERNSRTVRLECEEYARSYHAEMNGMVEERMRESIKGVGSIWFSAWVSAGQPDLSTLIGDINFGEEERSAAQETQVKFGDIKGRKHSN